MRDELGKQLYGFVCVTGSVNGFHEMKFDGHKTIIHQNPYTGLSKALRHKDDGGIDAFYYTGKVTLIINAQIEGKKIGDGHIWIPEDLSMKGFKIGEQIRIYGNVEIYQRRNGTYDYCIWEDRIEHA